ncbi:MAG: phospholipase [Planctomycetes bacterium]|nr:phospholipase [Planctomycetota bacterium]
MHSTTRNLGGLDCRIVDDLPPGRKPELAVMLCHGFGAPGTDLVPIGAEILHQAPALAGRVQFIFPAAPLSLDDQGLYGGRAWWPLDVAKLAIAIERGELRDQRRHLPPELPDTRDKLMAALAAVQQETGLPLSKFVLGGFSQGSMIATETALRLPQSPAALVIWSGTLLCEDVWRELAKIHAGLRVLQSHGRLDPILPFDGGVWLRDLLRETGAEVDFLEFAGPHTIPREALDRTIALLEEVA